MLTDAQLVTFKAHILANQDPYVVEQLAAGSHAGVGNWYNEIANPPFYVWRSGMSTTEVFNAVTWSGTGGFIARSAGERDAFLALTARGMVDPSRANIRQAFGDIFSGTATAAVDTRAAISAAAKRLATNIEKLFATGTGTEATPANLVFEGQLQYSDVTAALALP